MSLKFPLPSFKIYNENCVREMQPCELIQLHNRVDSVIVLFLVLARFCFDHWFRQKVSPREAAKK